MFINKYNFFIDAKKVICLKEVDIQVYLIWNLLYLINGKGILNNIGMVKVKQMDPGFYIKFALK